LAGSWGKAADAAGIQFRKLNLSRGPAVWSTRVQADRLDYAKFICDLVEKERQITVIESTAESILTENGRAIGVELISGDKILSKAVIVCTGTFLDGLIHIGEKKIKAGPKRRKSGVWID